MTTPIPLVPKLRMSGNIIRLPLVCLLGIDRENFTFTFVDSVMGPRVTSKESSALRVGSVWLLTYLLLTPQSRVVLEKLTSSQLVKKFPAFYGTRRFITAFTSARHLSITRASSVQSTPTHPTS